MPSNHLYTPHRHTIFCNWSDTTSSSTQVRVFPPTFSQEIAPHWNPRKGCGQQTNPPIPKAFNKSTNKNTLRSKDLQRPPHFEHRARPRVENIWDQNLVGFPHPKMNESPLKRDHFKRKIIFQLSCFNHVLGDMLVFCGVSILFFSRKTMHFLGRFFYLSWYFPISLMVISN